MLLGRSVFSVEDSPPRRVQLHDSEGNPLPVYALMRLLPKSVTERMLKPVIRKSQGKDEDAASESITKWMADHIAKTLVDTTGGFEWGFDDPAIVKAYSEFFPGLKPGEVASFDGKWTEGLKTRFVTDHPAVASIFLDAYKRLSAVGAKEREEEEEKKESPSLAG